MKTNILIAEDHTMVREALVTLLSSCPAIGEIWEARNGHEALFQFRKHVPQVSIIDYEMPNFDGMYATKHILEEFPDASILLLSAFYSRERVIEAMTAGIKGYLSKDTSIVELEFAIKNLSQGSNWFKGKIAEIATELFLEACNPRLKNNGSNDDTGLTKREKEVLRHFSEGKRTKEIASEMSISCRTVEIHKSNIYKKLKVNSPVDLVRYALKKKLIRL